MKKWIAGGLALACLLALGLPVLAAEDVQRAHYDLLVTDNARQAPADERGEQDPAANGPAGAREAPVIDAPVEEPTYHEEPSATADTPRLSEGRPGRGTIEAPDKYWGSNGYPADVSYAYEAGGEMLDDGTVQSWWEIGVVNADEARRAELLDLLSPACLVTFHDCTYPYARREAVFAEITAMDDGRIQHSVMGLNTEYLYVWTSPEDRADLQAELSAVYGDLVVVLDESAMDQEQALTPGVGTGALPGSGLDTGSPLSSGGPVQSSGPSGARTMLLPVLLLLAALTGALLLIRARSPAARTTAGDTVTSAPRTRKQTAAAVRASVLTPDDRVRRALLSRLRELQK